MPALALRGLEVRFPGLAEPALAIASLSIASGERLALRGPSGCGKTTLVNILTGLERPTSGVVAWDGVDIARLSEAARDRWRARNVGLVMQEFHLVPGLTAHANVTLPGRLSGADRRAIDAEATRLLARVGVPRPEQRVETLSRGQMQRVAVARALVRRPGLVVADEPTASLDAQAGAAVGDLLVELAEEVGATLVIASHDPHLLGRFDRVVGLAGGRFVTCADAA